MPFQPGNKLYQNRKINTGGRPKAKQAEIEKSAAELARQIIEQNCSRIMGVYTALATSGTDPQTTRHAVDKLLPEIKQDANQRPIAIQVIVETASQNGNHAPIESQGNGRSILIGGE